MNHPNASYMDSELQSVDDVMLAAYLEGTLSDDDRRVVTAYLADHAEAREVLCMAYEALEAAQADTASAIGQRPSPAPAGGRAPQRSATAPPRSRFPQLARFTGIALVIFAVGFALRAVLGPPGDGLRSLQEESPTLEIQIETPTLHFSWSPVPDAYLYRLVFWDPAAAQVVGQHETVGTELLRDDPFVQDLSTRLDANRTYTLRIDAVDARNRLIESSDLVRFQLQP